MSKQASTGHCEDSALAYSAPQRSLPPSPPPARAGVSWQPAMGIQGMELFAIGVVIILFMAVLKQFGILEPMSFDGECREAPVAPVGVDSSDSRPTDAG
ncbi:hypothetical protein AAFF_G00012500 [Aldrovandia affinis]|uniref:Uncharacterized protein n=1 Tax=Aldrovandia affinis TaxID=143900 RepID=A0AAD7WH95_9TELE|nr:hypothetical protein AAFF_G00012500 [Aldrovandia affinis]